VLSKLFHALINRRKRHMHCGKGTQAFKLISNEEDVEKEKHASLCFNISLVNLFAYFISNKVYVKLSPLPLKAALFVFGFENSIIQSIDWLIVWPHIEPKIGGRVRFADFVESVSRGCSSDQYPASSVGPVHRSTSAKTVLLARHFRSSAENNVFLMRKRKIEHICQKLLTKLAFTAQ